MEELLVASGGSNITIDVLQQLYTVQYTSMNKTRKEQEVTSMMKFEIFLTDLEGKTQKVAKKCRLLFINHNILRHIH